MRQACHHCVCTAHVVCMWMYNSFQTWKTSHVWGTLDDSPYFLHNFRGDGKFLLKSTDSIWCLQTNHNIRQWDFFSWRHGIESCDSLAAKCLNLLKMRQLLSKLLAKWAQCLEHPDSCMRWQYHSWLRVHMVRQGLGSHWSLKKRLCEN